MQRFVYGSTTDYQSVSNSTNCAESEGDWEMGGESLDLKNAGFVTLTTREGIKRERDSLTFKPSLKNVRFFLKFRHVVIILFLWGIWEYSYHLPIPKRREF